jgi:hypothetical protein
MFRHVVRVVLLQEGKGVIIKPLIIKHFMINVFTIVDNAFMCRLLSS